MKASYFIICIMAWILSATTLTAQVTQNENPASQKQILISQMENCYPYDSGMMLRTNQINIISKEVPYSTTVLNY